MDNKFNIGDIVSLESGTRKMKIASINGNNITCNYTTKNKKNQEITLRAKMLEKAVKDVKILEIE